MLKTEKTQKTKKEQFWHDHFGRFSYHHFFTLLLKLIFLSAIFYFVYFQWMYHYTHRAYFLPNGWPDIFDFYHYYFSFFISEILANFDKENYFFHLFLAPFVIIFSYLILASFFYFKAKN